MKLVFVAIISSFLLYSPVKAEEVTLLAASATSSTPASADITCLLDDNCTGFWQPASVDEGADEGLYFQFEETFPLYSIQMVVQKAFSNPGYFQLYLNGKTTSPDDVVYLYTTENTDDGKSVIYRFQGRDKVKYQGSLQTDVKSVFIKFGGAYYNEKPIKPIVKALHFYKRIKTADIKKVKLEQVNPRLPKTVSANIKSTSILEPITAYHPANLFDSRYDFAWSTDGKTTNGIGEKLILEFHDKQTITGLYVWNGYQRSPAHFAKNGRVKELLVRGDGAKAMNLEISSKQGLQKIMLSEPLQNVSQLELEIGSIFKGTKYKDVLISELRFVDAAGDILRPAVQMPKLNIDKRMEGFVDRSWSVFLHGICDQYEECIGECFNKRIRLRSNGTFVIYSDYKYGASNDGSVSANILEGNWSLTGDQIRIFGKKYTTELRSSDYIKDKAGNKTPSAKLFQSYVTIKPYSTLSEKEKTGLFSYLLKSRLPSTLKGNTIYWTMPIKGEWGTNIVKGKNTKELLASMKDFLEKKNPYYIKSSVITDLLLPTTKVESCSEYY